MVFHQPTNSRGNFNYNANIYRNTEWNAHFHGNFELIYAMAGQTKVYVSGREEELSAGQMLLIFPFEIHAFRVEGEAAVWVGVFSEDTVSFFAGRHHGGRYIRFACEQETESFLKRKLFIKGIPALQERAALLSLACAASETHKLSEGGTGDKGFADLGRYISCHISEDITMRSVAQAMGYEYHYFSALFHRHYSLGFKEFVNMYRFAAACTLLTLSQQDIAQVAAESGFQSIRNFNRIFRKYSGVTPAEYRKFAKSLHFE